MRAVVLSAGGGGNLICSPIFRVTERVRREQKPQADLQAGVSLLIVISEPNVPDSDRLHHPGLTPRRRKFRRGLS